MLSFSANTRQFNDRQTSSNDIIETLKQKFIQLQTELNINDPNILFEFARMRAELRYYILTATSSSLT